MIDRFLHGVKSATSAPEQVRDAWLAEPGANVGLAPDGTWIMVDVDPRHRGTLDDVERLGLDVSGYRERSAGGGWHVPLVWPL